ncbi:MAG: class I mannose-6-phosphate isomerase [Verrucomicrobia bacterium]|nr:class I mannose-6-phosphate isomerase [Verrucomicrobiota bacterium]
MLYPLTFHPIFKERVWGGRRLAELFGKRLPAGAVIGESWEITDRPEGVSVIGNGPLAGKNLRWLMENGARDLLGPAKSAAGGRFPLLVKLLDAREKLSLQVHPPAHKAAELHGEPKTEMWYFAECDPGADIFTGLKRGVTPDEFKRRVGDGTVAECFHRHEVKCGDAMFLPSGRVHALGAGSVLFEIQQNSDTTYRVFDWNRTGLDGQPRELHVAQALASIDFADFEPPLLNTSATGTAVQKCVLVDHDLLRVTLWKVKAGQHVTFDYQQLQMLAIVQGQVIASDGANAVTLKAGEFAVLPWVLPRRQIETGADTTFLLAEPK